MRGSELLNSIAEAKRSQVSTVRFVHSQDDLLGSKMALCGCWLHLREWIESGESRLRNANFCKQFRLCRACARRRAGRLIEAYLPKVEQVVAERPQLIPAMVTLSVKNGPDLAERLQHLKSAWSAMLAARRRAQSPTWRHGQVEWNKVEGSLRSFEVTLSKSGEWHPHAHCYVLLSDYVDQAKLSAEWLRWTGDSFVVGVTKCHGGVLAGLCEVMKYAVKFSDLTDEQLWYVHRTTKGQHLFDGQGCLRGVSCPDIDADSDAGLTGPYRDLIARWLWNQQRYELEFLDVVSALGNAVSPALPA